jgi:hypothetical protein
MKVIAGVWKRAGNGEGSRGKMQAEDVFGRQT